MNVTPQQRENYKQALEAWKQAARDAQKIKDQINSTPTTNDNIYLMTDHDVQVLNKEYELYQRLINVVQNL